MATPTDYFAGLPLSMQNELVVIARTVIGMDALEKYGAKRLLAIHANTVATEGHDALVETGTLLAALMTIVADAERRSGEVL